ncbi:MAG: NADH-quinone oxidoreductase subunit J [Alistipes senegalensis]|nr:NADH-quinone oxidoreductase subunit J [Oxalobacter formigenes]MCM1280872.1 NADH-quinone oxidoreductase subunit J [Alistipes senegalensis]
MAFQTILFYLFAAILVLAALRVVTAGNPVHAALYLVLSFFSAAAIWILLEAEFLALILVLVYVGAVMVLFLFVVMMLDIDLAVIREGLRQNRAVAVLVGLAMVFEMAAVLVKGFWEKGTAMPLASGTAGLTRSLGKVLYTDYLYAFEIAAAILMVAMVAAVALTLRRRKGAIYTSAARAVAADSRKRLRLVEMEADTAYRCQAEGGKAETEEPV